MTESNPFEGIVEDIRKLVVETVQAEMDRISREQVDALAEGLANRGGKYGDA